MAKRKFDFNDDAAAAPKPAAPVTATAPATAPVTPASPAMAAAKPAATSVPGTVRPPGLRHKPKAGTALTGASIASVIESRDHTKLATLFADGRVEDADNLPLIQFRANGDIEDASQRVLGRFLGTEIRDQSNRVMAVLENSRLTLESREVLGYFTGGRLENEARQIVGYISGSGSASTAPAAATPAASIEPRIAAYLLFFQPNLWQEDQP